MLYNLLKFPTQLALWIFCRHISISKKKTLSAEGPLLIAANHPNSFLDAIILSTLFNRPVYSLARGDGFKNKFISKLLASLNMLPVYRKSEGAQNIENNYGTFNSCKKIFKQNGIVLMFSEGKSENEWHLRPLMKGTARLAMASWADGIDLKILPAGINYNSFTNFGKNVQIDFGNIIEGKEFGNEKAFGHKLNSVNKKIETELKGVVLEIEKTDLKSIEAIFYIKQTLLKKIFLFIPAIVGYIIHYILYKPIQKYAWAKGGHNGFYDSVLLGMLFIIYPFYLLLITVILLFATCSLWSLLVFLLLPFCAWSYVQLKKQF